MKKIYTSVLILCLFITTVSAQGIYQLWGSLPGGGPDNSGVIFSTKHDATGFKVKHELTVMNPGAAVPGNKPVFYNGKLYALLGYGGIGESGIIGEFDPLLNTWTKKADLFNVGGHPYNQDGLIVYNNKLYGITGSGGLHQEGAIFEFNPANNAITVICNFSKAGGAYPTGLLTVFNNKFYGVTRGGGLHDNGVLFEFDPASAEYTKKADFNEATTGSHPEGSFVIYSGRLWGTTSYGALNNGGVLYSFDPVTNILSKKFDFESIGMGWCLGSLAIFNNKFYGATSNGGTAGFGGIFEYNPATNQASVEYFFSFANAHNEIRLTLYNNKLYSASSAGGAQAKGAIFSYDPISNLYQDLYHLNAASGSRGSGFLTLYNNELYGFTNEEALYGRGSLIKFKPADNSVQALVHFDGPGVRRFEGSQIYFNNKIYGFTTSGGTHRNGGIYEYDPITGDFVTKVYMEELTTGQVSAQGGFTELNGKLYAVTRKGGTDHVGALLEYDPATNILIKRHDFTMATGAEPRGQLTVYNGKLYGTCHFGSSGGFGNIFEFDPATNNYAERVVMGMARGTSPRGTLTLYNNRLYGVAYGGGANSNGTVFEYRPNGNIFTKMADFNDVNGSGPWGGLCVLGNKLYGMTYSGGIKDSGVIYSFDPANSVLQKLYDLDNSTGNSAINGLTALNNKLFGMVNLGAAQGRGAIFQFDPATNTFTKRKDLGNPDGSSPFTNELRKLPAPAAPGSANSCTNANFTEINAANSNEWIAFTDSEGRAVAEINANGNILSDVQVRFFINDGSLRTLNGTYYADRNITITSRFEPVTPVSVRLYLKDAEFLKMRNTAGSGVILPADISLFKNDDFCADEIAEGAAMLPTMHETWGRDHVYTTEVTSFSSFYFASVSKVLPVKILSFTGNEDGTSNKLTWKASCTNDVKFIVERSADGIVFNAIGEINATQADCNSPFIVKDEAPLSRSYYRLKMTEISNATSYSGIVMINRDVEDKFSVQIVPNPVVGSQMTLKVNSVKNTDLRINITDVAGRVLLSNKLLVQAGTNNLALQIGNLPTGVYYVRYDNGIERNTIKMIKQ